MAYCNNHYRVMKFFLSYLFVLSGIFGIAGISEAIAKEYFVAASSGNDKGYGTKEAPFVTLEKGVSVLSPGDTLYVRGGTYTRNHYLWEPPNGKSWENAITIKAYQNEKVIIKPLQGYTVFEFKDNSAYIMMGGFIVEGGHDGFRMGAGSHHIRIFNSEIKNNDHQGIQVSAGTFHEFINLSIHHNGLTSQSYETTQSHGIYNNGSNTLTENCEIFENGGWGIHMFSTSHTPSHNIMRNNRIYNNNALKSGGPGIGIYRGTNNSVINNIIWGNRDGIVVDSGASNTKIYNNTVYTNERYGMWLGNNSDASVVKNNFIYMPNDSYGLMISKGSGVSNIENNLIIGSKAIAPWDPNAILKNNLVGHSYKPGFADASNHDFHLTKESSAIGKGLVIAEVKTDFEGVPRDPRGPFDIGAYVFGSSFAPPTDLAITSYK